MTDTPALETRILDVLRSTENRTKMLRPKDFNASASSFGTVLDEMIKCKKIYDPSNGMSISYFSFNVKNVDSEVEVMMCPEKIKTNATRK